MTRPKCRVLVVDDNASDRLIVRSMLMKLKLTDVQEAENGTIGVNKIITAIQVEKPFDLVIIDWNMPQTNGLKVLRYITEDLKGSKPKLIVMTGSPKMDTVKDAIEHGADDFIVKPVDFDRFKEKLEKLEGILN